MLQPRRVVLALFLAALLVAAAEAQRRPVNDPPTDLKTSDCYNCHATGGGAFGPPLRQMYALAPPGNISLAVGEAADFSVEVINTWTALLEDIDGILDLTNAPSLGFASDRAPVHTTQTGQLPTPAGLERSARVVMEVPTGATDVILRATPGTGPVIDPLPPDISLRLWPPGANTEGPPVLTIDDAGSGGTETFQVKGSAQVSAIGTGNWTVEAHQANAFLQGAYGLIPTDVAFGLDAWFNTTGERASFLGASADLDGQDDSASRTAVLPWRLIAEFPPGAQESMQLTVNATAHYDHPGTTSNGLDDWRYTDALTISILGGVEPGDIDIGADDEIPETFDPVLEEAFPWDRLGEIIGYVSTFLLLFSLITGGVFGKGSRRGLNKVFRSAKRRVAFHNFISYLLTLFAVAHTVVFLVEPGWPITLGLIWGSAALLAMVAVGVTGAFQVPIIRRWSFNAWRRTHFWLAIASLVFTLVHMLLDGANFTEFADFIGWRDPFQ